jgi:hypothetical protein
LDRTTISRDRTRKRSFPWPSEQPVSVSEIVSDFTGQLLAAIERATIERGKLMLASMLPRIQEAVGNGVRTHTRAADDQRQLVSGYVQELLQGLDTTIQTRLRELLAQRRLPGPGVGAGARPWRTAALSPDGATAPRARKQIRRRAPVPPPRDPEQIKRDEESARLRALLRPASEEIALPLPAPIPMTAAPPPPRPTTPGEELRALEREIQDAVPSLAGLGPERCGAQIAAWTGQVRQLRDGLPPDVSATMRPAFRIFLEHLTQLRLAMDAHAVDALEPSWNTPDWNAYVEVNRARAEERTPDLPAEKLLLHHRTMLRALLKPHRRNLPEQAGPIINAAAQVLPPDDSQLKSAKRRHASAWEKPAEEPVPASAELAADNFAATAAENPGSGAAEDSVPAVAPAVDNVRTPEGEFDSPWTE